MILTARSILSLRASITAAECSAALPTMATMIRPTKSSVHPMVRVTGSMWLRSSGFERPDDRELEKVPPSLRSECDRRGVGSSDQDQIGITVHLRRRQHRLYRQTVRWF